MTRSRRFLFKLTAVAAWSLSAFAAQAQTTLKIANIVELTGPGTTAGTMFRSGVELALKDINAAGGILGRQIESVTMDTQTNPGIAKGLAMKAIEDGAFAIFGPVYTGSIMVSQAETRKAEMPNFTAAAGASVTLTGNPYIFRTGLTQTNSMPKTARYMAQSLKVKKVAVIYVNNDFGKPGRDAITQALKAYGVDVVADISTETGQIDFAAPVIRAKQTGADSVFVYLNEEESARALKELRKQGWNKPIIGDVTLLGQKVLDLAGEAANGVVGHSEMTADAPIPAITAVRDKFFKEYKFLPDHNGIKGYQGLYMLKAGIEKAGKLDKTAAAKALHGMTIKTANEPGILMDLVIDEKGDIDRASFIIEVQNGKPVVKDILPPLGK
jgi:branched-chain amino acid transport system substrate-binding protein